MIQKIKRLISRVLSLVPTKKTICYNSFPDFSDNAYAMFHYLYNNDTQHHYGHVWLINDKTKLSFYEQKITQEYPGTKVYYKTSIPGLYNYIRARFIFYTHGLLGSINLKQHEDKYINLWHGMPLKRIGLLEKNDSHKKTVPNIDKAIATSELFVEVMANVFGIDKENVLCVGQPRNDLFLTKTDFFTTVGIDPLHFSKIGIWMPTYRLSINENEIREDGEYIDGMIGFCDMNMLQELDGFLNSVNQLLIIKIHPMDKMQLFQFPKFSNIHIIKPQDFSSQLYPLLGHCDYMITDFSSVMFDYDILKRPMGFVCGDISKYGSNRGFVFDNILDVIPGDLISSFDELKRFIEAPCYHPSKYCFNKYCDPNASKRIADILNI